MNKDQPVTREYFVKRLGDLCARSGMVGFPKDELDQHILLKSAVISFEKKDSFTEQEINRRLDSWIELSQIKQIDRSTLRRWLVDAGYLTRAKDGSAYQVAAGSTPARFEEAVEHIDVDAAIENAREEIARRKREYLERSAGQVKSK